MKTGYIAGLTLGESAQFSLGHQLTGCAASGLWPSPPLSSQGGQGGSLEQRPWMHLCQDWRTQAEGDKRREKWAWSRAGMEKGKGTDCAEWRGFEGGN